MSITADSGATSVPLARRKLDIAFLVYFAINLVFVTYIADLEQLVIADPNHFTYPAWPPRYFIDAVHAFSRQNDPVVMAREAWFRATIWVDVVLFGPFYVAAIYAFARGRNWIRIPALMWAAVMLSNVWIVAFQEVMGRTPSPNPRVILAAMAPWAISPLLVMARLRRERPFSA